MANSTAFREAAALAVSALSTHCNVHTGDPGTTGVNEALSARGAIVWVGGAVDGTVVGNQLTLANVPAGTYTHVSLFSGASGANYQTSYQLSAPITLTVAGPINVTPQYVYPA
jgi:hypothetical protein